MTKTPYLDRYLFIKKLRGVRNYYVYKPGKSPYLVVDNPCREIKLEPDFVLPHTRITYT